MNTIIMLFALPIGLFLLSREKKAMVSYEAIFTNFFKKVKNDPSLSKEEKIELLEQMLYKNHYQITHKEDHCIKAQKKIFSIGWMFIGIGTLYIGLIGYIFYYLYFQKPHQIVFKL